MDGRPLLPRPTLRQTTPTSIVSVGGIRSPIRAPASRQATPRQALQKRSPVMLQSSTSTPSPVTQMKPKFAVVPGGTNKQQPHRVSSIQAKPPQKLPQNKPQSLISPQQKLLMAKRKAQEQAGVKPTPGRAILTGARATPVRGKPKPAEPVTPNQANKPKESKLAEGDGLHMEFHEVNSEESSSEEEPEAPPPAVATAGGATTPTASAPAPVEPESPPNEFSLCPLTGRIIGPDGEPVEQPEPEVPEPTPPTPVQIIAASEITPTPTTSVTTAELVLPSLEGLTDASGMMRVEMSPGGTTGTIVQTTESEQIGLPNVIAPDLPCLDDSIPVTTSAPTTQTETTSSTETAVATSTTTTTATVPTEVKVTEKVEEEKKVEEAANLVTITGDDGVVYQVAGQAEDGQTLLVTRGADGEQQCVYVTTDQQGEDGSVLTLDHAVAEAVAHLLPDQANLSSQFYVKEGEGGEAADNQMVMSIMEDPNATAVAGAQDDTEGQVVAQVVQADDPTPGKLFFYSIDKGVF